MRFYSSDMTFVPGCSVDEWAKEIVLALEAMDREPEPGPKLEKWARDAGFQNVNHLCLPIPVGIWPKDQRMVIHCNMIPQSVCLLTLYVEGSRGLRSLDVSRRTRSHVSSLLNQWTELVSRGGSRLFACCPQRSEK